jgi:hypothetical protein
VKVKDVGEKGRIRKDLRSVAMNTKRECLALLSDLSLTTKILYFLPLDDKNDMNIEIANEILNLLIDFSELLFRRDCSKEKIHVYQSKLKECDCFDILLLLLNIYKDP